MHCHWPWHGDPLFVGSTAVASSTSARAAAVSAMRSGHKITAPASAGTVATAACLQKIGIHNSKQLGGLATHTISSLLQVAQFTCKRVGLCASCATPGRQPLREQSRLHVRITAGPRTRGWAELLWRRHPRRRHPRPVLRRHAILRHAGRRHPRRRPALRRHAVLRRHARRRPRHARRRHAQPGLSQRHKVVSCVWAHV